MTDAEFLKQLAASSQRMVALLLVAKNAEVALRAASQDTKLLDATRAALAHTADDLAQVLGGLNGVKVHG